MGNAACHIPMSSARTICSYARGDRRWAQSSAVRSPAPSLGWSMNDIRVMRAFPALPFDELVREDGRRMDDVEKENARRFVLKTLGISSFVTTAALDISAGHRRPVEPQRTPARLHQDG